MAEVLYRKWRPQTFDDVVGQEHVVRTLRQAVEQGRIAHAYLLAGPRGTGKTTMGRLLAKAVNCMAQRGPRPCGQCEMCRAIGEGRSLDLIELDAASERGIDDIRQLREGIKFSPAEGRYKVYILDEAHMLTEPAFNALLKTLEEPPPHVILVLVTTEPGKIPLTILSRCQRYDFRLLGLEEIQARLEEVATAEGLAVTGEAREFIARQARGALRDALSLLDQFTAYTEEEIGLAEVQRLLGAVAWETVGELMDALIQGELGRALGALDRTVSGGVDAHQLAEQMVEYWRGLLLLKSGGAYHGAQLPPEVVGHMERQAERLSLEGIVEGVRLFSQARWEMRAVASPSLPLELAVVETAQGLRMPTPAAGGQQATEAPAAAPVQPRPAVEPRSADRAAEAPAPAQPPPAVEPPSADRAATAQEVRDEPGAGVDASVGRLVEHWPRVIEEVRRQRPLLGEWLRGSRPVELEGNTLILGVTDGLRHQKLSQAVNKTVVGDALRKVVGRGYALRPKMVEPPPAEAVDDQLASWASDELGAEITAEEDGDHG